MKFPDRSFLGFFQLLLRHASDCRQFQCLPRCAHRVTRTMPVLSRPSLPSHRRPGQGQIWIHVWSP
uniref:Secreted protein n=1 Tax=Macrostomum lignano TaxID=282301 RepID=A0A1I8F710_9PLAT